MIPSTVGTIAILIVVALAVAAMVIVVLATLRGRTPSPAEAAPLPTSLSFLAGFSFFSGLGATALVVASALLFASLSMGDVLQIQPDARQAIGLAAKIVLYVSLLPSVAAIAFALAARGVISESGGTVRGRPLYRTGVLLSILSVAVVVDARIANPSAWVAAGRQVVRGVGMDEREINRGYLGVELEGPGSVRVVRVVPGSPAERAGIQSGDRIMQLNGNPSTTGSALIDRIGTLAPGSRVTVGLRRGAASLDVTAELAASFETLHSMLSRQDFDDERLAILKAAGADHRYSADELTKICESFDFDEGRLKAIEAALPHLQDPQNAYRILGSLEFSEAKSKAGGWIAQRARAPKEPKEE
jgi:membrane-associated protease RseP (regulator of RpoE activity)